MESSRSECSGRRPLRYAIQCSYCSRAASEVESCSFSMSTTSLVVSFLDSSSSQPNQTLLACAHLGLRRINRPDGELNYFEVYKVFDPTTPLLRFSTLPGRS